MPGTSKPLLDFCIAVALLLGASYSFGEWVGVWHYPEADITLNTGEHRLLPLPFIAKDPDVDPDAPGAQFFLKDRSGGRVSAHAVEVARSHQSQMWHRYEHWKHSHTMKVTPTKQRPYDHMVLHGFNGTRVKVTADFGEAGHGRLLVAVVNDTGVDLSIAAIAQELWRDRPSVVPGEVLPLEQAHEAVVSMPSGVVIVVIGSETTSNRKLKATVDANYVFPTGDVRSKRELIFKDATRSEGVLVPHGTRYLSLRASRSKGLLRWSDTHVVTLTEIRSSWAQLFRGGMYDVIVAADAVGIVLIAYAVLLRERRTRAPATAKKVN